MFYVGFQNFLIADCCDILFELLPASVLQLLKYQIESCLGLCILKNLLFLYRMRGGQNGHRRKSTNDRLRWGSLYRYYDAASGTIFRIFVRFSQKKQNPSITFIFDLAA
jgi:hypothetical protein